MLLVVVLGMVAATAAAIVLNLVLLGYTSPHGEPVGRLSPAIPVKVVQRPEPTRPITTLEKDD
jgi:hypothetical protein